MPRNGNDDFGEALCDDPQSFINQRRGMFDSYILKCSHPSLLQGDPNQNLKFLLAIILKTSISGPRLVKPKCVWLLSVLFSGIKNFQKTWEKKNFLQK